MKVIVALIFKLVLLSRYKFRISSGLNKKKLQSTLILPNHPAEIDPLILCTLLWNKAKPRPIVLETVYDMPILNSVFNYIGAIAMPDMETGSGYYKRKRIGAALNQVVAGLHAGDNFLIYPSGRLSLDGREVLGGASGVYKIITDVKDCRILLIRTRGLWGSRFSKADTDGARPDILKAVISSFKTIASNLFFFVPKRTVSIDIKEESLQKLKAMSAVELNQYLQSWYDFDGGEQLALVKNHFLDKDNNLPRQKQQPAEAEIEISPEIREKIIAKLAKISEKDVQQIKAESRLSEDLALDSLSIAELIVWFQEEFDIADIELAEIKTANSLFRATKSEHKKADLGHKGPPASWSKNNSARKVCLEYENLNLAAALVQSCKRNFSLPALSDPALGVISYKDFLRMALIIKKSLTGLSADKVAILLPASGFAAIVSFAAWLCNKTPVYLNWTTGLRGIRHAVESLKIQHIISAGSVLDKINIDLSEIEDKIILIEEIRQTITLSSKVLAFLESLLPARQLINHLQINRTRPQATAAVLFTSGSESVPKAVPLSHQNILANIKAILQAFKLDKQDVFLAFLPPFHSFGLTVTTFLPLISGIRVAFHPNPNDSRKIASACAAWQASAIAGTPSFIKGVMLSADSHAFDSLRIIMSGAEKLSEEVRELTRLKAPKANLLEGYGITECAPVVCAQRLNSSDVGVGSSLPGVSLKIVDPNTYKELPAGQTGLILINGDSVFSAYLESDKDPFITIDNKKWYNSGDLGFLQNNCLVIAGRLKRFIKIGGEMISLPAIEEALIKVFNSGHENHSFAIVDKQEADNARISLFLFSTKPDLTVDQVNTCIRAEGFAALAKIKSVKYLEEFPLLGSGKIDIQKLRTL